ncbi:MAG: DegT/DnrJ/EryC1/StrS family aminotransferase [Myxococcota bacterium]
MIPLARPNLGRPEQEAVAEVLRSGMLVSGARVARFEAAVAERCGRAHGVAVSSGTSALELALQALGVGREDQVVVPALTWPSPAHATLRCGATPVLVDVDADEWNAAEEVYGAACNDRTRAAVVIDQLGNPARRRELAATLDGVPIVEDAACALGSVFDDGSPCGSFGAVSCLSFHPRKILATGEGGMCLTDDAALADRLRRLRNHGQAGPGDFREPAGNHRLTEIAAALGLAQLERLDHVLAERSRIADRYRHDLENAGLAFQRAPGRALPNHQTVGALLPDDAPSREVVIATLADRGVQAGRLSYSLSLVDSVAERALVSSNPVNAERIAERGLALPAYAGMTEDDQGKVIAAVREALSA